MKQLVQKYIGSDKDEELYATEEEAKEYTTAN